ncbi:hypothetical protein CVP05_08360 [Conservatibacter flavescens]|uniref:D12 class N6 adenine-specific DNA methyltransferase n=2 Tax=Conservatibacter flavescens TaxID=28161 RepID=A0A2M8S1F5_9PAST|nr:hypothetical protein CVP05_08360 [Conservatibacter flavescens]
MFLNQFKQVLNENIQGDGKGWTIIDVFGGSGLLSETAKRTKPVAEVIYNDFDGYSERLKHIDDINKLRQEIFQIVDGIVPRNKRLDKALKEKIINKIKEFNGFIDLASLSSWLLFSGNQVATLDELYSHDFWHCVRQSDYPEAGGYLDGVTIIRESFHTLIPRFKGKEKVLLVLDPPYLCTRQESYKQERYFDLIDFLRLIHLTEPPYIFFSSTKSEFIRFIDYLMESKADNWQAFENYKRIAIQASASHNGKYEDNLVYKF